MALLPDKLPGEGLLIRLWESVERLGIGLASPTQIMREGKARAEVRRLELLIDARTRRDIEDFKEGRLQIGQGGQLFLGVEHRSDTGSAQRQEPDLVRLASDLVRRDAVGKLINLRKIVTLAEDSIEAAPREPVDEGNDRPSDDWLGKWRAGAESVSDEQMQLLWARALAGESRRPGSFSLRTLSVLVTISKPDAELIYSVGQYCLDGICLFSSGDTLAKRGIDLGKLLVLEEMGVVSGAAGSLLRNIALLPTGDGFLVAITYHRRRVIIVRKAQAASIALPVVKLSATGAEIMRLGRFDCDDSYLRECAEYIKGHGFEVSVADWQPLGLDRGLYLNELKI